MNCFVCIVDDDGALSIEFKLRHDNLYNQIRYELKKHYKMDIKKLEFQNIEIVNDKLYIQYFRDRSIV